MTYVKLTRDNNWGSLYYRHDEKTLEFNEGQKLRVKWPDGTKTKETITMYYHTEQVSDHGHSYHETSILPGITVQYKGLKLFVDNLEKILVESKDLVVKRHA
jgi:hypothetical protein